MPTDAIFKEIMREYERDRDAAARLSEMRKSEIYKLLPRIEEIDTSLGKTGAKLIKKMLDSGKQDDISAFRESNLEAQAERARLLEEAGYRADYITDTFKCRLCKDTGYIDNREKCSCLRQRVIMKRYAQSNLTNVLEKENFDMFNINCYSSETNPEEGLSPRANIRHILNTCLSFVSDFNNVFANLLLYGKPGLGKTFLCNCIAKELLDRGRSVLYTTAPQLFKKIEDFRFRRYDQDEGEPEEYNDFLLNADLLIIDDLGTEFISVVTSSELFNIVNTRFLNLKPTIISTNMTLQDLKEQYSERITSRITGNYTLLKLFGDDIRVAKKYK